MALLQAINLSFSYPASLEPQFESLSVTFSAGWTGVVGANGSGKTTLLRLAAGELAPSGGSVAGPDERVYCDQRVEEIPEHFDDFLNSWDERAVELIRILKIDYEWLFRWNTLSFGERKRAQLASALWHGAELLAVDEPTNHLDSESRSLVCDALARWEGIGIVVSHDRELLDRLCSRTLFLSASGAVLRPGGVSQGLGEEGRERVEAEREREQAMREERRLKREAQRRTEVESRATKRLSKRGVDRHDKDTKGKIDAARISGKDRRGSDAARDMRERAREAGEKRRALGQAPRTFVSGERAIAIEAGVVRGNLLVELEAGALRAGCQADEEADEETQAGASAAANPIRSNSDHDDSPFTLEIPHLAVRPTDRIAICGPNGSGKSTLLEAIAARLRGGGGGTGNSGGAIEGRDRTAARDATEASGQTGRRDATAGRDFFYMRQELSAVELRSVRERLDSLDRAERGRVLALVTRLGSDPERLLDTAVPSPGEARKLALALASLRAPQAMLLDEPTNHLDLPAIVALEGALSEYTGCLFVVSHDKRFIEQVTSRQWHLEVVESEEGGRRGRLSETL